MFWSLGRKLPPPVQVEPPVWKYETVTKTYGPPKGFTTLSDADLERIIKEAKEEGRKEGKRSERQAVVEWLELQAFEWGKVTPAPGAGLEAGVSEIVADVYTEIAGNIRVMLHKNPKED